MSPGLCDVANVSAGVRASAADGDPGSRDIRSTNRVNFWVFFFPQMEQCAFFSNPAKKLLQIINVFYGVTNRWFGFGCGQIGGHIMVCAIKGEGGVKGKGERVAALL